MDAAESFPEVIKSIENTADEPQVSEELLPELLEAAGERAHEVRAADVAPAIPAADVFYSAVTRDPFPDPDRRSFTFHFRQGVSRTDQLRRMAEVLRVSVDELGDPPARATVLPSPLLGHDRIVADLDRLLASYPNACPQYLMTPHNLIYTSLENIHVKGATDLKCDRVIEGRALCHLSYQPKRALFGQREMSTFFAGHLFHTFC